VPLYPSFAARPLCCVPSWQTLGTRLTVWETTHSAIHSLSQMRVLGMAIVLLAMTLLAVAVVLEVQVQKVG